jgi:hypothetical protein
VRVGDDVDHKLLLLGFLHVAWAFAATSSIPAQATLMTSKTSFHPGPRLSRDHGPGDWHTVTVMVTVHSHGLLILATVEHIIGGLPIFVEVVTLARIERKPGEPGKIETDTPWPPFSACRSATAPFFDLRQWHCAACTM